MVLTCKINEYINHYMKRHTPTEPVTWEVEEGVTPTAEEAEEVNARAHEAARPFMTRLRNIGKWAMVGGGALESIVSIDWLVRGQAAENVAHGVGALIGATLIIGGGIAAGLAQGEIDAPPVPDAELKVLQRSATFGNRALAEL